MILFLALISADTPDFGRVDKSSLPEQVLMELVVSRVDSFGDFHDPDGFKPISKWTGLNLNDFGNVISIVWESLFYYGTIDMKWLPAHLESFCIEDCNLLGSLETPYLPVKLLYVNVAYNQLSGNFDASALPPKIEFIDVTQNLFMGGLSLQSLPCAVQVANFSENCFEGGVILDNLPPSSRGERNSAGKKIK